jgi:hypothetical protein
MKNLSRRLTALVFLLALTRAAEAQSLTASFTYPTPGATNVDLTLPVQWTAVANAQAYYLYLGSSFGAKDLANTGELQTTSYQATNIPTGVPIYARLATKVAGAWRSIDITFTVASVNTLEFTYPAPGTLSADMSQPFQWTAVPNAQAYYLYVGSAVGLNDLANSGERQATSFLAYNLPLNPTTLYLRLWVKLDGRWRYIDRTVIATNTATQLAQFLYPANGATNMNVDQAITWSTALNAQKYYLYIGSTPGAKDLVNSGEMTGTSYLAQSLPSGVTLYARLWTRLDIWRYVDITFKASPGTPPTFTYPTNGSTMDITLPFSWTSLLNAQGYQLLVGTTAGGSDIWNSGNIMTMSMPVGGLPTTGTVYARIMAKVAGNWRFSDIAFSTSPITASLITPANGSTGFNPATTPFTWTSVPFAKKYYLYVGTAPGLKDLIDSQELCDNGPCYGGALGTSWNGLQGGKSVGLGQIWTATTLYARLWTMVGDNIWRYTDSTVTTRDLTAFITNPLNGTVHNEVHTTVTWNLLPGATAYRVTLDVLCDADHDCNQHQEDFFIDSGVLSGSVSSYDVAGTPAKSTLILRVYALVDGVWRYTEVLYTHQQDL